MTREVIPATHQVSSSVELAISEKGGHVGFVQGTIWHPEFWLEQAIPDWLSPFFNCHFMTTRSPTGNERAGSEYDNFTPGAGSRDPQ